MTKNNEELYFVALIPPQPFRQQAWELKKYFREQYNSKASLNSPPHITLHMPFKLKPKREKELILKLQALADTYTPFEVVLSGFDAFKPRVIFIDVVKSKEMDNLQADIKKLMQIEFDIFNADYKDRGFHPHITLAFRDLRKAKFYEAWKEFDTKELSYSWIATEFTLLKHDGKRWQELKDLKIKA